MHSNSLQIARKTVKNKNNIEFKNRIPCAVVESVRIVESGLYFRSFLIIGNELLGAVIQQHLKTDTFLHFKIDHFPVIIREYNLRTQNFFIGDLAPK